MNEQPVLALDVGGSSVKSALVVGGRHILGNVDVHEIESRAHAREILTTLAAVITPYLQNYDVLGIALAFPGPFDYVQGICWIQDQGKYEALYSLNVGEKLREILGRPTLEMRYRNDAEAAILGEALYGAGAPYSRLLGLTLGTGLGSAFLVDDEIITQGAGVPNHGWLYSLPYGTQRADDVFSTRGLLARLRERGIVAADIASAIRTAGEGNPGLEGAFASFGADLGTFLGPFVSNFGAEAVLITGGIAAVWKRFAPSLKSSLPVPVRKGTLGRRAALLGAAALYA